MNPNAIINMIMRLFLRRGMNAGINYMANRGRNPKDMTPEERQNAKAGRENARRAQQAMRVTRRMGKF
mgnify:CR=1 FL=1|tara:strand:- start:345 stop:548 length:204 start_codon:yes stop_codon:yes gene_type:complete